MMKRMIRKTLPALIMALALGFYMRGVACAEEFKEFKEPVSCHGDKVDYYEDQKKIVGEGNVVVEYKDVVITAEKATVFLETKEAYLEGDVVIKEKNATLRGKNVVYNFNTQKAQITESEFDAKPFYGKAEDIEKLTEKEFVATNGYVTTCEYEHPHYTISARQLKLYPNDKVVIKNAVMRVRGVPILWIPYYVHPLDDRRPRVTVIPGSQKDWGMFVLTAWRYYINEQAQGRIHLDYREKKDFATGADLKYDTRVIGSGLLRTYYMNERSITRNHLWSDTDDFPTVEKEKYRIQLRHRYDKDPSTYMVAEYNRYNDPDFIKDYFKREYDRDSAPASYMTISKFSPVYSSNLYLKARVNDFEDSIDYLPRFNFNVKSQKIGTSDFYYTNEDEFSSVSHRYAYNTHDKEETNRFDTYNELYYVKEFFGWLNTRPYTGMRNTWYSRTAEDEGDVLRNMLYSGISFSTKFYKLYNVSPTFLGIPVNGVRHVITPTLSYNYVTAPTVGASRLEQFDSLDSLSWSNSLSPSIINKVQTKRMEDGRLVTVDILRFEVGTSYNFHGEDTTGGQFSNLTLDAEFLPVKWLSIYQEAEYDMHTGRCKIYNLDWIFKGPESPKKDIPNPDFLSDGSRRWEIGAGWRYRQEESAQLTHSFSYVVGPNWKFSAYNRFDVKKFIDGKKKVNSFAEQEYVVTINLHCWTLDLVYNVERNEGHGIYFIFKIKAFPGVPFAFKQTYHQPRPSDNQ